MAGSVGKIKFTEQTIQNFGFDETYKIPIRLGYVYNPATGEVEAAKDVPAIALKLTESGVYTYVAKAVIGASQASAVWQAFRIDETSGMVIEWAEKDGTPTSNFVHVATDLTALSYS